MSDTAADLTGAYELDPAHTRLGFVARHAMVTNVRGQFKTFTGHLHINEADPSKSNATVTVEMASLTTENDHATDTSAPATSSMSTPTRT